MSEADKARYYSQVLKALALLRGAAAEDGQLPGSAITIIERGLGVGTNRAKQICGALGRLGYRETLPGVNVSWVRIGTSVPSRQETDLEFGVR